MEKEGKTQDIKQIMQVPVYICKKIDREQNALYIYNHELNKGRTECIIKIKALFCHHICNQVQKKQQLNIYTLSFQGQNISPPVQINIIHIKQTCFSFCQWKIIYMLNTLQPPPRELHKWMQEAEKK